MDGDELAQLMAAEKVGTNTALLNQLVLSNFDTEKAAAPKFTSSLHLVMPDLFRDPQLPLTNNNTVNINNLSRHPKQVQKRKFLLCRIVKPWFRSELTCIESVVEDPEGSAARLQLHNFSSAEVESLNAALPIGTVLALKNPVLEMQRQIPVVVCEYPGDVAMSNPTPPKWKERVDGYGRSVTAEECREIGNHFSEKKKFEDALLYYSRGLKLEPNNFDILSNRSVAYVKTRRFHLALADAEAVLRLHENHSIGIQCKAKSLCGIERHTEAANFLEKKLKSIETLKDCARLQDLLAVARELRRQAETGEYDIVSVASATAEDTLNYADYTGPVKVAEIEGKGLGLIATEDIRPGQLVIASKAFATTFATTQDFNTLVSEIINVASCEPERKNKLLELYAGKEFPRGDPPDHSSLRKRVENMITYNAFLHAERLDAKRSKSCDSLGFWLLPSLINHSCVDWNCSNRSFEHLMMVRALKAVAKGEELLVSYASPLHPLPQRKMHISNYGFDCTCRLCVAEESLPEKRKRRMYRLLQLVDCDSAPRLESAIEELEMMNADEPLLNSLNYFLLDSLANIYYKAGEIALTLPVYERMYGIIRRTQIGLTAIRLTANLVQCYFDMTKDLEDRNTQHWVRELKEALILYFGSVDVLKVFRKDLAKKLCL